jgi:O-antigen biosynthesis protein
VRAELPDATFRIVGSEAPKELLALDGRDGLAMVGWVADLTPEFERVRVSVAPIRYGAGIKGKVAVALAHGVASVVTPCAAEGMGLVNDRDCLIEEDPARFAAAVVRAYRDDALWTRLSQAGMAFVDQTYGRALGRRRVAELLALAGVETKTR